MAITIPTNATHTSYANDSLFNQAPNMQPSLMESGIAASQIDLLDTQSYSVDIFNDWLSHKTKEFPMLAVLANLGKGEMINEYFYHYWDEYEGTNLVDVAIDNLRQRDSIGDEATIPAPFAVGAAGEIGGKIIWQPSYLQASNIDTLENWSALAASAVIVIEPKRAATNTIEVPQAHGLTTSFAEIREYPFVTSGAKKLMSLGFSNKGTATASKFSETVGFSNKTIRQYHMALKANDYKLESFAGCTINGSDAETVYSLTFDTSSSSKRVFATFDDMELMDISGVTAGAQSHECNVVAGIDKFIYNAAADSFILVLDWAISNMESTATTAVSHTTMYNGNAPTIGLDGWYLLSTAPSAGVTYNGIQMFAGAIFRYDYLVDSYPDTASTVQKITTCALIEEVNTSTELDALIYTSNNRIFGLNVATTGANAGGNTRMSRHIAINMFNDLEDGVSETDGFSTEQQSGYSLTSDGRINYISIVSSKPWSVSTMRQGMKQRFKDNYVIMRERSLAKYRRVWHNKMLWNKKANYSSTTSDGAVKTEMSGLLDYEMHPIKYLSNPLPTANNLALKYDDGGLVFMNWIDTLAKGLNYNSTPGEYEDKTLFCSLTVINYIKNTNALIVSDRSKGNVYGGNVTLVPGNELTLGLDVMKITSSYGSLNFIHDKNLDVATQMEFPRFLFPTTSGKLLPKYVIFAIDKSFIKLKTQASRPERIYGNLQSRNNPFVYTEGISGAHTLVVRNMGNHAVINVTPNT